MPIEINGQQLLQVVFLFLIFLAYTNACCRIRVRCVCVCADEFAALTVKARWHFVSLTFGRFRHVISPLTKQSLVFDSNCTEHRPQLSDLCIFYGCRVNWPEHFIAWVERKLKIIIWMHFEEAIVQFRMTICHCQRRSDARK